VLRGLAKNNYSLGLVTSGARSLVHPIIEKLGWCRLFSVVVCGDDVRRAKPSPDIYLAAVDRSAVPGSQLIVVEDSENGVRAAVMAGLRVVGCARLGNEKELCRAGATVCIGSLNELSQVLGD
ncbi:MAG: HAD-IA family hydrolase, partial [Bdellovibrionales bacterium]|nr:HAD-IA family hydrolase [Bdellovibrionales bacterium]